MNNVSNAFAEQLANGNQRYLRYADITLKDGTVLNLTNADFWSGGFKIEDATSADNVFQIGGFIIGKLTLVLNNMYGDFTDYDFEGASVVAYVGLEIDGSGTVEKVRKGHYIVSEATGQNSSLVTLGCLDNASKFNKPYSESSLVYPASLASILRDACTTCGVVLYSAVFDGSDYVVQTKPDGKGFTFGAIISAIAQIACKYARINSNGQLQFGWYSEFLDADAHEITSLYSDNIALDDVVITGVKVSITDNQQTEENLYGQSGYILGIENNPLVEPGKTSTIASMIGRKVIGLTFRPMDISIVSNPTIEAGDKAYVTDRKGDRHSTYITRTTFTPGDAQSISCEAETPARNSSAKFTSETKIYATMRKIAEKQQSAFETAIGNIEDQIESAGGYYVTEEVQQDQSVITYTHNKPTLAESTIIWKETAETRSVSTDGGQTWNAGLTADGQAIVRILSAEGINANWITTGVFEVRDGNNNVLFLADKDTGRVYVNGSFVAMSTGTGEIGLDQALSDTRAYSDSQLNAYVAIANQRMTDIENQIDGQYETYFEDYAPTLNNYPANEWTTDALKAQHEGDLFYDKSTGNSYRFFMNDSTGLYEWSIITDTVATQALAIASHAQDTADGKRRVFVAQPTPPYDAGDLWFTGNEILVCDVPRASGAVFVQTDFSKHDGYTDDSALNTFTSQYSSTITAIQESIDKKAEIYWQATDPSIDWDETVEEALQDTNGSFILDHNWEQITTTYEAGLIEHEGDLWHRTTDNTEWIFKNGVWQKMDIPDEIYAEIGEKAQIFVSTPTVPYNIGDLWVQGANGDILKSTANRSESDVYTASDWVLASKYTDDSSLQAFMTGSYAQTIAALQSQTDGKAETWYQSSDPSTAWTSQALQESHEGDIWYNTVNGRTYLWNGSSWSEMTSNPPASVFDTIDGKAQIFISEPTTPYSVGDLWFDSATSDIMTCIHSKATGDFTASDWQKRNKYTDDSGLNSFRLNVYDPAIASLQQQVDSKIETWYQDSDPSALWSAVSEVVLQDSSGNDILDTDSNQISVNYEYVKILHEGDLWHKTTDNTEWIYRSGVWEPMDVPDVLWDTVDSKKTIYSSQPVPPYNVNDLWVQGEDGDILRCKIARESGDFEASDWVLASKYTDDTGLLAFINGSYADTIGTLQTQIDGRAETWYQSTDPSTSWTDKAVHEGDLWYKTTDNTTWYYTGSAWREMSVPLAVFDTIDTKAQVFASQPVPPYAKNDVWFTGTDILVSTMDRTTGSFVASDWIKKDYYTDDSALTTFLNGDYADTLAQVQNQLDGKIETWYQASDPSTAWTGKDRNVPLLDSDGNNVLDTSGLEITTDFLREAYEHIGDIWQNTNDGTQWRWNSDIWEEITVPDALVDKLDGKAQVFVGTPKTPYQVGDILITGTGSSGSVLYCTTERTSGAGVLSDFSMTPTEAKATATIQTLNGTIIAQVVAGNIINAINMSSEGIRIDASNLNINGAVSANNYFKINTDGSFETIKGKIGSINIDTDKIYTTGHSAVDSSTAGFMLHKDGMMSIGNSSTYLRFYKNVGNAWKLDMKVDSLQIAGVDAATATDISEAEKTATNYLNYSADNGLVVSETGTQSGTNEKPYNTQIKGGGIYFRQGTRNLALVNGTNFTLYRPGSTDKRAMELQSTGLYFFKSDGTTVSAQYTDSGFEVLTGKIGSNGFSIDSRSIYRGTLGASGSVYLSAGTSGEAGTASIGGSQSISGWAITAGANFGVTTSGALYARSAKISGTLTVENGSTIGGWTIRNSRLANADNSVYLGTNGFKLGDNFSVNSSGNLTAAGANISGTINATGGTFSGTVTVTGEIKASTGKFSGKIEATSGSIGGWTIDSKQLYTGSPGSSGGVYLSPAGYKGDNNQGATICDVTSTDWVIMAGSYFGVKKDGSIYSRSGKIADFTIAQKTLSSSVTSNDVTYTVSLRSGTSTSTKAIQVGTSSADAFYVTYGGDMVATKGSIAGITMEGGSIYSNSHKTYNSSNAGFLLKSDGTFSVGDSSSYIRYYYDSNSSSWKMAINAASLSFGGYTVAKKSEADAAANAAAAAQSTANSAHSAAALAQSTANAANTNAATAQTTANTANTNAATAQSTANAKSRTFTGTSVPTPPYDVGDIWISGNTSEHRTRYCTTPRASGKGYASDWSQTASQAAANAADTKAGNALSAAESAGAAALDAQTAAENAAKTATNYMTFVAGTGDGTGLFLAQSSNYSSGANMRLTSDMIQIRSSSTPKMEITGSAMRFYRGSGNNLKTAMKLDDDALIFYKKNSTSVAATVGVDGLEVKSGIIGGFVVTSSTLVAEGTDERENEVKAIIRTTGKKSRTKVFEVNVYKENGGQTTTTAQAYIDTWGKGYFRNLQVGLSGAHYININSNAVSNSEAWSSSFRMGSIESTSSGTTFWPNTTATSSGNSARLVPTSHDFFSGGYVIRLGESSSIRYKNPIEDMSYEYARQVLDITPAIFRYKYGYLEEGDESAGKEIPGFYAEDVERCYEMGVYHNPDGTVENWKPERIIPAMLRIMQEQQKEIERLKEAMA